MTLLNPAPVPALAPADWANVDILTPNRTETQALLGHAVTGASPEETARELSIRYGVTVVMTLGADGAVAWPKGGDAAIRVPAFAVSDVTDTTGAGDGFNGALAAGLAAGLDLADAVRLGTVCGSLTVARRGVIPALPTLAEATAALNATGCGRIAEPLAWEGRGAEYRDAAERLAGHGNDARHQAEHDNMAGRLAGHRNAPSPRKGQP
ncbi:MAG: PfkB family carbohydrate kinase [Bifidobacteriaceae bacterium]|nr:PfkB family carbohydrate kinase [Bifidobacteriaceae bacterium]